MITSEKQVRETQTLRDGEKDNYMQLSLTVDSERPDKVEVHLERSYSDSYGGEHEALTTVFNMEQILELFQKFQKSVNGHY